MMRAMEANPAQQLMLLRRSLRSLARAVMRGAGPAACEYEGLKGVLLDRFNTKINGEQAYIELRARRWDRNKSLELFVEETLLMAKKAKIPEEEAVLIVIDHLTELNRDSRSCLSSATTSAKLKELLKIHRHRLFPAYSAAQPQRRLGNAPRPPQHSSNPQVPYQQQRLHQQPQNTVRCFNCLRTDGHTQSQCPYPIRDPTACFRCWLPGHNRFNCPNPPYRPLPVRQPQQPYKPQQPFKPQQQYQQQYPGPKQQYQQHQPLQQPQYQRQQPQLPPQGHRYSGPGNNRLLAAAVQEPQHPDDQPPPQQLYYDQFAALEEEDDDIDPINQVSVQFEWVRGTHSKSCLLDSGSPASLIRLSAVPREAVTIMAPDRRLHAIGVACLQFMGAVNLLITFRLMSVPCRLVVVPDFNIGMDTLLGRDFMKTRGLTLRSKKKKKYTMEELQLIGNNKQLHECTPDLSSVSNLGLSASTGIRTVTPNDASTITTFLKQGPLVPWLLNNQRHLSK